MTQSALIDVDEQTGAAITNAAKLRVVALDLSLASTGICASGVVDTLRPPAALRGHERMQWIRRQLGDYMRSAQLVVVEGPAYSRQANQKGHHERAGLWWIVTHQLWAAEVPTAVVTPGGRAKYATGKGNAPKDAVLAAIVRRFPAVNVANNNEADALALAAMAYDHYGHPIVAMPQTHRVALDAVDWPELAAT